MITGCQRHKKSDPELTGRLEVPQPSCQEEHHRDACLEQLERVGMQSQACQSRCTDRLGTLRWGGRGFWHGE